MNKLSKFLSVCLIAMGMSLLTVNGFADSTQIHPITWKGKKWEYLVEFPRDLQHVDPERFEEILDTAGQHGWELVTVSHAYHFYAFYFKRELLPEKLAAHRARLKVQKSHRAAKEATMVQQVIAAQKEKQKALQAVSSGNSGN